MDSIRIKELRLENFKCHKLLVITPNGANVSVYGDNATGKSSIYDALTWLLFGKDSHGNDEKSIEIKPLDLSGNVADHQAITSVEATLTINGEEIQLRRTYQEVWTTKRGSAEQTYSGNTSEYYVNGVPVKKFAYQDRIRQIVDEGAFQMMTSVSYFAATLPWQKRREMLFEIAGIMADRDIMATSECFAPLAEAMGKLSLNDYKAMLLARKRSLSGARNEIPARINECQKTLDDLSGIDFDAVRADRALLQAKKELVSEELRSLDRGSAVETKQIELREAQLELEKLESENRVFRDHQRASVPDSRGMKRELAAVTDRIRRTMSDIAAMEKALNRHEATITYCRDRWIAINSEAFQSGSCPTCGQALPADQLRAAKENFDISKQRRLHEVELDADVAKKAKASCEESIAENNRIIEEARKAAADLETAIANAEAATVTVLDVDGYADRKAGMQKWIEGIQADLFAIRNDMLSARKPISDEKDEIERKIAEIDGTISKEATVAYVHERIEKLREEARDTAESLAKIEQALFDIDEFARYKVGFIEENVNRHFRIARFRLFREQANGGIEDRCDVVYNGVPYVGLNSGMRINVGIDIINALSAAKGLQVPLIIDNAESVTHLEPSETQTIRLVVDEKEKELNICYEN